MRKQRNVQMWARLRVSEKRVRELEAVVEQKEREAAAEGVRFSRALALLENSVEENVALKRRLRALQALANGMEV